MKVTDTMVGRRVGGMRRKNLNSQDLQLAPVTIMDPAMVKKLPLYSVSLGTIQSK